MKYRLLLKLFFSVGLSSIILFNIFPQSLVLLSYEINKLEIIEKFCINKDKAQMQCEGKCHLSKQLDTIDQHSNDNGVSISLEETTLLFPIIFKKFGFTSKVTKTKTFFNSSLHWNSFPSEILTPPPQLLS